ncbi:MAG: Qat anti-phage system TatD family nuclease QatD [Candidatus Thiodiazotropha sp.]
MVIIDLHCHLDLFEKPDEVISRANKSGIYVLSVTTTPKAWAGTNHMARKCPRIKTALGLHPQLAHERYNELPLFKRLLDEVDYVGEIGLDGSKYYKQHLEIQRQVFGKILSLVEEAGGKIMTVHSRGAVSDVLSMIERHPNRGPVILHWFTGSKAQMQKALALGCWFSIGPKMFETKKGRDLISELPPDRILFETDGPFAKRNNGVPYEPVDTLSLAEKLRETRSDLRVDYRSQIMENFRELISFRSSRRS